MIYQCYKCLETVDTYIHNYQCDEGGEVRHMNCMDVFTAKERKGPVADHVFSQIEYQARIHESKSILDSGEKFWIIWNPTSDKPPRMVFGTETHAWNVAEKMAEKFSSDKFYVCESLGHCTTLKPVVRIKPSGTATLSTRTATKTATKTGTRKSTAAKKKGGRG